MANLNDMRNLVALIKGVNDECVKQFRLDNAEELGDVLSDSEYWSALIEKEDAIRMYMDSFGSDEQKTRDIYGDATSNHYKYLQERPIYDMTKRVDVMSAGRTLAKTRLLRLWGGIRTGYWGEVIEKSSKKVAIIASIILTLAAVANAVLAYYSH